MGHKKSRVENSSLNLFCGSNALCSALSSLLPGPGVMFLQEDGDEGLRASGGEMDFP